MEEEERKVSQRRDGVRVHEEKPGRYAMVSKRRIRNGTDIAVGETWQHESDHEVGDNDPNLRR